MAAKEQQRQKKLAKQQSRERKAKRELARKKQELASLSGRMRIASRYPIVDCKVSAFEGNPPYLSTVVLSRRIPGGEIAMATFLLDCGCLGVKNAHGLYCTPGRYSDLLENIAGHQAMLDSTPERARALIEQTVQYAAELGFSPHSDFHKAFPLFGDIDASQCTEKFPMGGQEGKPVYIAGPHEDWPTQNAILSRLTTSVGEGNFRYVVAPAGSVRIPRSADVVDDYEVINLDDDDDYDVGADDGTTVDAAQWERLQ